MKTVIVCGGGASGMLAALTAAEDTGNRVILFERQARVGRKLLSTGNGRCNLTNIDLTPDRFHGEAPAFALSALEAFPPEQAIAYFRSLGLVCTRSYGGRVYPLSDSAGSVLDVLRFALSDAGVEIHTGERVTSLTGKKKLRIGTEKGEYEASAVIIACGGKAGGKLGGVPDGYELLSSIGHRCTRLTPSLVPVWTEPDYPRALKGVRADASVCLVQNGQIVRQSTGEVQFVERGVSGPAVFDLSRDASRSGGELIFDFIREASLPEVEKLLRQRFARSPYLESASIFAGILHSRLGLAIVKASGVKPSEQIGNLTETELVRLASAAKHFSLRVTGTDSFENAQVTAGGMDTTQFDPLTLQSRLMPGVFACGEVLDIDADCGGYNLQWAWASGRLAGRLGR